MMLIDEEKVFITNAVEKCVEKTGLSLKKHVLKDLEDFLPATMLHMMDHNVRYAMEVYQFSDKYLNILREKHVDDKNLL